MGCFSLRSLLLAAFVLSNCITWTASRHSFTHNASGHRRRHSRHRRQGAGLYLAASYIIPGGEGSGGWGEWGEVSPCSRTCGGGVASQKRICLVTGSDGRPNCTGGDTKYFSCQTQDCPEAKDFRAEQCSAYDNKPFKGVYHKWVPYTHGPRACELNCMPKGERFYYRHQHKVVDGTRCNNESFDVCVNGECQPVGCDMMLGSNAREDKCRECRGNGTNCKTMSGLIDTQDLIKGYNDILLIPQGATSILIEEIRESNNYLALRSQEDRKYYLNGDYHIDFPRSMHFAGALWYYERSVPALAAPDRLRCSGPTTEPLYLSLLLQEDNVGVKFEYSIPTALAPRPDAQYVWVHDVFTPCSVSCGSGFMTRTVTCRSREELEVADDSLCDAQLRPSSNESCRLAECAPAWRPSEWGPCSKPCGQGGSRSRQVQCEKIMSAGQSSIVDDKQCFDVLGPKPELFQKCNSNASCPTWFTGPWKPCDKLCGEGKQTRQVVCHHKNKGRVEVLVDGSCADEKPPAEKPCMIHPCDGIDWVLSEWSGCDNCLSKVMSREAECTTTDRTVVDPKFCAYHPVPELEKPCDPAELPACQVSWYATQWSNCSVDCGKGVKTRRVFCGKFDGASVIKVDDSRCDNATRYNDTTPCEVPKDKCPAKWFAAPWSACTEKCGGGKQYRKVMCLSGGKPSSACDEESMLYDTQSCNIGSCDLEELLPVDATATAVMDEEEDECEEEEVDLDEGQEVGAGLLSSTFIDLMFSDSPSTSEGSGFSELETEFTPVPGTGFGSDLTGETGSGDTTETIFEETSGTSPSGPTSETAETASASDMTDNTGSTVSGETTGTEDLVTEASDVTGSDATGPSTESSTTDETSESGATESTVPGGSTDSTSPTDTEGTTIASETGSLVTEDSSVSPTEETGATETESSTESVTDTTSSETITSSDISTTDSSATDSSSSDLSTTESATDVSTTESSDLTTEEGTSSRTTIETTDITASTVTDVTESTVTEVTSSAASESTTDSDTTESAITGSTEVTETSSTDATISTEATETGTYETMETGSTESEITTESESTTESGATETTESEGTELTDSTTTSDGSSTTEVTNEETSGSEASSSWDWLTTVKANKPICKPRKRPAKCMTSTFGCCPDKKTPAAGPFDGGCPNPTTCKDTKYGCCPDGVSPAGGKNDKDCPEPKCEETLFGCCKSDNRTPAEGNDQEGCPPPPPACRSSKFGCCKDDKTPATGPNKEGCPETTTTARPTTTTTVKTEDCTTSEFGCCYDNKTAAAGPDAQGCPCNATEFGCCPDGVKPAGSIQMAGCVKSCNTSAYGCCPDGETPAHGPEGEGCCLLTPFGCCPDNYKPADGPHLEGCGCQYAHFGCCPDHVKIARGPDNEGCGCAYSAHGCCPDRHTEAAGPDFEGCGCHTYQFGCCPDGVTIAKGPSLQGCDCRQSKHGCCGDGVTPATGPGQEGCDCASSQFGCCPDGVAESKSSNFSGCADVPVNRQAACSLPEEQGPCYNYSVQWFFDMKYGGCSQFYYGGCEGNGNRFANKEECEAVCVEPAKKEEVCRLPKVAPDCPGRPYEVKWYYDSHYQGCAQFQYRTSCLGNANRFDTREECEEDCAPARVGKDQCKLTIERGSCAGNFSRWGFNEAVGRCEQFSWGGCEGNNNRFISEAACVLRCQPPSALQPACTQPQDTGNCTDKIPAWSFSQPENRCVPFYYTGCGGNDNRYSDEQSCNAACPSAFEPEMCTLPAVIGECGNYRLRWFYDTTHLQCRQFYYGGCGGNGNNFETEEECRIGCVLTQPTTTTPRPTEPGPFRDEFCLLETAPGHCSGSEQRWAFSAARQECVPFQYTGCGANENNFPSKEYCQLRCQPTQDICQLPMKVGPCRASFQRWFFDASSGRCSQFTYGGCEGNTNNFQSAEECEARCRAPPAPGPTPTAAPAPTDVAPECRVSALDQCIGVGRVWYLDPSSRSCTELDTPPGDSNCSLSGVFPSPEACERSCGLFIGLEVCRYPVDAGPCTERQQKYHFDAATGSCLAFTYGGCHGTANRFSSIDECESVCMSETDPCKLRPTTGNCSEYIAQWYYDEARDDCNQFAYTGCGGNANRFATREECEGQCKRAPGPVTAPTPTTTHHTPVCSVPQEKGSCDGYHIKWYYDEPRGSCLQFIYSGCGGNGNRFETREECEGQCRSAPAQITSPTTHQTPPLDDECRTPYSLEPCGEEMQMFYFDSAQGRCLTAQFGGCRHPNSYRTEEECERHCGRFRGLGLDVCRAPLDPGPCREPTPKFYWNLQEGRCAPFTYGGCLGGANRFSNEDECNDVCGELTIDPACRLPPAPGAACAGAAAGSQRRWHRSSLYGDCRPFVYLGCGGNGNNFLTLEECERHCSAPSDDNNEVIPVECSAATAACAALQCSYGRTRQTGADGCDRCSCDPHPCADLRCPQGQRCQATPYRDLATGEPKYSSECRPDERENEVFPDCSAEKAACSALQCDYGVQRSRGAGGCEHCACVVPEPNCRPLEEECRALKCNYGPVTRTRGADGCERCTCIGHPCDAKVCPAGQRCVAAAYRDAVTGDTQYSADCRTVNKPGYCPSEPPRPSGCRMECSDDADCRGVAKCCAAGCSRLCQEPAEPTTSLPDAPHAPRADPDTERAVSATEGGAATLRCLFHSNPPPKITWKRGEITIDGTVGRYRLTSDGALEIVSLYRNDSGVYICVAENGLGSAQQEVELRVDDPVPAAAGIAGEPVANVVGNLGRPLAIRCLAYGYPAPSIAWYRGPTGPMVPYYSETYEARDNLLLIRSLEIDTLGEYTCQAYNGLEKPVSWTVVVRAQRRGGDGGDSPYLLPRGELAVTPRGAPAVTPRRELAVTPRWELAVTPHSERADPNVATPQPIVEFPTVPKYTVPVRTEIRAAQTSLVAGSELNLPCEVDGHPEPRVYWTKDGVQLAPSDRTEITAARLTVSGLTEADSGVYGCHAQNEHSSHHSTVQINVQQLYIPPLCTDNHYFANCKLIVRSKLCVHDYYSKFCCKSCVEAGVLNPQDLQLQADQSWMNKK